MPTVHKGPYIRSKYSEEYNQQIYKLCLLGATLDQIGDFFNVTGETIARWRDNHPALGKLMRKGKLGADAQVAKGLYRRAVGCSHPDTHIAVSRNKQGEVVVVQTPIRKYYPPDPTAATTWLRCRQPDLWQDKQGVTHTHMVVPVLSIKVDAPPADEQPKVPREAPPPKALAETLGPILPAVRIRSPEKESAT